MTIKVWDYLDEYRNESDDIKQAVATVFESGQLVLGPSVEAFERSFAGYHAQSHCIGVDNGTNAIKIGLEAAGIDRGDEVITVSNTAAPTVVAIDEVGARARFVDVVGDTYLMDVTQLEDAVTPRTRAIVAVHLYGQCVDMEAVRQVATRHGLVILEDCAQAHGARYRGHLAGTMGNVAAFSFYPTKVLGAYGDGGAILTDSDEIAHATRRLRYYGMEDSYYVVRTPGHNSRLDAVQAEILRGKLSHLDEYIAGRRRVAERYHQALAHTDLVLPAVMEGNEHVYYLYVVRHERREQILQGLRNRGIDLSVSYRWPIHTMSGFEDLGYRAGSLPTTERLTSQIFSLPMYPALPTGRQDQVIEALLEVLDE